MASTGLIPPPVSWAQRSDVLYVIIDVECKDIDHKVTDTSFTFKGTNVLDASLKYEITLNFLHPVDPEKVTSKNIGRCLEFTIPKKENGPYWPSLTKDKTKLHFLKANFAKWRDESDEEEVEDESRNMFSNLTNNAGYPWKNKYDDFNIYGDEDEGEDSDDSIPSLYQNDEEEGAGEAEKKPQESVPVAENTTA